MSDYTNDELVELAYSGKAVVLTSQEYDRAARLLTSTEAFSGGLTITFDQAKSTT